MENKFFLHRIQEENGTFTKGVEVHDTLDSAVLSFWGRVKSAYNNPSFPEMEFVSCKITDSTGKTVLPYDMTWWKNPTDVNTFFLHYIRKDGENYVKGIDALSSFDAARSGFAAAMEYGYNNSKFPDVSLVSCEVTDRSGLVMTPFAETWVKAEEEPEPEPDPQPDPDPEPQPEPEPEVEG